MVWHIKDYFSNKMIRRRMSQPVIAGLYFVLFCFVLFFFFWLNTSTAEECSFEMWEYKMKAGKGTGLRLAQHWDVECMVRAHTYTHKCTHCGFMFQLIWAPVKLHKCLVPHWFRRRGEQSQKANFLASSAKNTNFSVREGGKGCSPATIKARTSYWVGNHTPGPSVPLFLFVYVHSLAHTVAFIQSNSASACFQRGHLPLGLHLQPRRRRHFVCLLSLLDYLNYVYVWHPSAAGCASARFSQRHFPHQSPFSPSTHLQV